MQVNSLIKKQLSNLTLVLMIITLLRTVDFKHNYIQKTMSMAETLTTGRMILRV
jgi:hypothetical protein